MANERNGGFPEPPFEDDLRTIEAQVDKFLTTQDADTQWGVVADRDDWVEASRILPLGSGSQQELRVAQQLGPHPNRLGGVIYSIVAFGSTMTWPAGTEDRQRVVCSDGQHPADMVDGLLASLVDVASRQLPSNLS